MPKHICDCPSPPGGRVVCEAHQLAICRVRGGQAETLCVNVRSRTKVERLNEILQVITMQARKPLGRISQAELSMLRSGTYSDPKGRFQVSFSLPEDTDTAGETGAAPQSAPPAPPSAMSA